MAPFFFYDPEFIFSLCGGGDGRVRLIVYLREEEGQGWEMLHDLGEYRSISCSFNALVFIIHDVFPTRNRMTWLLCKDSGLGTLGWGPQG